MVFDPGLSIGQILKNAEIVEIFKCSFMGGMRRSWTTNTLVLVSNYTNGIYHDKWIGGVLHYTGMGKTGDQDIKWAQNATLAECKNNGVDVHLFESIDPGEYIYCGRIELVEDPYTDMQIGEDGNDRKVWIFPIRPVPNNNVKKPQMYVFKDMEDYKLRGKNVDAEYAKIIADKKNKGKVTEMIKPVIPKFQEKPLIEIPSNIIGKQVKHKSFGIGVISAIEGTSILVDFDFVGRKKIGYEFCINNNLVDFIR